LTDFVTTFVDGQELEAEDMNLIRTNRTGNIKPIDNTSSNYSDDADDLGSSEYNYKDIYMKGALKNTTSGNEIDLNDSGDVSVTTSSNGDINLTPDGTGNIITRAGGLFFENIEKFTSNGTFTVPTGVKRIYIEGVGGGGGAAGVLTLNVHVEGGSNARAFTMVFDVDGDEIATIDIVLGAGGAGGNGTPTAGAKGGDTTLTLKKANTSTIGVYRLEGGLGSSTTTHGYNLAMGRGYASILGFGGNAATAENNQGASGRGAGGASNINTTGGGETGGAGGAGAVYVYW
jgi:hypothetical protein